MVPAGLVPAEFVKESFALATNTRVASGDASIETAPVPTGMVRISLSPTASTTLTRLPVQLAN